MSQAINFSSYLKGSIKHKNTVGVFRNINTDTVDDISTYDHPSMYNLTSANQSDITGTCYDLGDGMYYMCRTVYDNEYGDSLSRYTRFKSGGMRKTGLKRWTECFGKMWD